MMRPAGLFRRERLSPAETARRRKIAIVSAAALAVIALPSVVVALVDSPPRNHLTYSPPPSPPAEPSPPDPDTVFLAWGPSEGDLQRALETARSMSVEEEAGLVIVARFKGASVSEMQSTIRQYHWGGVFLSGGSIQSRDQFSALVSAAKAAAAEDGRDWDLIVAVDQEGGTVAHVSPIVPTMPAFMAAGAVRDHEKAVVRDAFAGQGRDLRALGVNADLAPVADLTIGLADPVIRSRSPGLDPHNAAESAIAAVDGLLDAGVVPAVKHFPGHGGVTIDSHTSMPVSDKPLAALQEEDLLPFQEAIDAGAPMIMMSHVAVSAWGGIPASIDPEAYAYLRDEMGFTGVTITDSMGMGALGQYGGSGLLAVKALNAGADLILMPGVNSEAYNAIVGAVDNGTLSRERLDEAASRVIALMRYQASIDPEVEIEGDYVKALSLASATVVTPGLCGRPLVGSSVTIRGGWASERNALSGYLAQYGIATGGGTSILLLGTSERSGTADVVVALDGPWGLSSSHATTYIGLYGRGPSTLSALADILAGKATPMGRWPVPLAGLPYDACPSPR
jgi:beta-N-acetylhexosaminidase